MPKRITEEQKEVIYLEIEHSRIEREKSKIVLSASLVLYFCSLLVGVFGFIYDYLDPLMLNIIIVSGLLILILGTVPYVRTIHREERRIKQLMKKYTK